jgi:hypothetical protein
MGASESGSRDIASQNSRFFRAINSGRTSTAALNWWAAKAFPR